MAQATLPAVLAAVAPGRVARLALTAEQHRALRDPDGRLALDVVRHLLGARAAADFLNVREFSQALVGRWEHVNECAQLVATRAGQSLSPTRARPGSASTAAAGASLPTASTTASLRPGTGFAPSSRGYSSG